MLTSDSRTYPLRSRIKSYLMKAGLGRAMLVPFRLHTALGYYAPQLTQMLAWAISSREATNFTFEITRKNYEYLAHTISAVTGVSYSECIGHLDELQGDEALRRHVINGIRMSPMRHCTDERCSFGRRLGWYAFVRILKPRVIVETGVDKGLGSVTLCAALMRNQAEGFPGRYFGTDKDPDAGFLFTEPYSSVGEILYGDSIHSLESISEVDIFINDSDHSAEYERREYEVVAPKLRTNGLILGDNSHCTDVLAKFSAERGRQFIFFNEQPKDHWYPGAGIGISFVRSELGTSDDLAPRAVQAKI